MKGDEAEIRACEERLRRAMLSSDVPELEQLLSDRLVFTDQFGKRLGRAEDLAVHRSGLLSLERIDFACEPIVRVLGQTSLVWTTAELAGAYAEQSFVGTFAYSRVWHREGASWQVVAAHCSAVAGELSHDGPSLTVCRR